MLSELAQSGTLPHLIFYGPENSGKTTAALALARQLYGRTWKNNFVYFNASDFFDQGKRYLVRDKRFVRFLGTDDPKKIYKSVIDIFKEIINEYAGMASLDADYKLLYIDNAESLNSDGQHDKGVDVGCNVDYSCFFDAACVSPEDRHLFVHNDIAVCIVVSNN